MCRRRTACYRLRAGRGQPLGGVLADRLQHGQPARAVGDDQAPVDQPGQDVDDLLAALADLLGGAPPSSRPRRPTAGRTRSASTSSSSWALPSSAARMLRCRSGRSRPPPVSSCEQLAGPLHHVLRRQHPGARGGQLQRQRLAVEHPAELGHGLGVVRR